MAEPKIVDRKPILINLEAGTHYWCAYGRSSGQHMCDASHGGTDIAPLPFDTEEEGDAALCLCKYTKNPPYCDGTHASLDAEPE